MAEINYDTNPFRRIKNKLYYKSQDKKYKKALLESDFVTMLDSSGNKTTWYDWSWSGEYKTKDVEDTNLYTKFVTAIEKLKELNAPITPNIEAYYNTSKDIKLFAELNNRPDLYRKGIKLNVILNDLKEAGLIYKPKSIENIEYLF